MEEEKKILAFRPGQPGIAKDALGILFTKDSAKHMIRTLEDSIVRYADSDEFYVSQNGTFIQP